jgi:hypothetical protein
MPLDGLNTNLAGGNEVLFEPMLSIRIVDGLIAVIIIRCFRGMQNS